MVENSRLDVCLNTDSNFLTYIQVLLCMCQRVRTRLKGPISLRLVFMQYPSYPFISREQKLAEIPVMWNS